VRLAALALAALVGGGCGYIGSPLPPLVNIPARVTDLNAFERASRIVVTFTVPHTTTEGVLLKPPVELDLRIGPPGPNWEEHSSAVPRVVVEASHATAEIPAADWTGREVTIGARVVGANRKESAWSSFSLRVVPPLPAPAGLKSQATAQGVHLTWEGSAGSYRVFRRGGEDKEFAPVAQVDQTEWTDRSAEYGQAYAYRVQRIQKVDSHEAQSEFSPSSEITPVDTFPPATPSGLNASGAPNSIELTWERNTEPDLAGYRLYRAVGGGPFEKIADVSQVPAYSDQMVEKGKSYRYQVAALDRAGNESARSAPAEAALP
jgi:hypothetical protein